MVGAACGGASLTCMVSPVPFSPEDYPLEGQQRSFIRFNNYRGRVSYRGEGNEPWDIPPKTQISPQTHPLSVNYQQLKLRIKNNKNYTFSLGVSFCAMRGLENPSLPREWRGVRYVSGASREVWGVWCVEGCGEVCASHPPPLDSLLWCQGHK